MNKLVLIDKEETVGSMGKHYENPSDYRLFNGGREVLRELQDMGFQIFFLTSSDSQSKKLDESIKNDFLIHGIKITEFLYDLSDLQQLVANQNFDLNNSYLVTASAENAAKCREIRGFKTFLLNQNRYETSSDVIKLEGGIAEIPNMISKISSSGVKTRKRKIKILDALFG